MSVTTPFENAVDRFFDDLAHMGRARNTILAYRADLRDLLRFLGEPADPATVEAAELLRYFETFAGSHSTALRRLACFRSFFALVAPESPGARLLADYGIAEAEKPAEVAALLDDKTVRRIVERAPEDSRERAVLEVAAAGLTASEIVGLALRDLDLDAGEAWVCGRQHQRRRVTLATPAWIALRAYLKRTRGRYAAKGRNCFHVFLSVNGRQLTRQDVWDIVRKHAQDAGVGIVNPSDLRRSAIVSTLAGGASHEHVKNQFGHSLDTALLYAKRVQGA